MPQDLAQPNKSVQEKETHMSDHTRSYKQEVRPGWHSGQEIAC